MEKLPIDYVSSRNKNYFLFKQDIGLTSTIREGKIWEKHLYDAIKDINFENTTIIDIGANLGVHTLEFADLVGEGGKVYAFEPQRIVYYQLCANIIANGYNNIFAFNKALSNKNGITHIERQNFYIDGLLNIGDTHISNVGDEVEEIKLDDYNLNNVSLIKMDVQGYEHFVLNGSIETIKRNNSIILIEIEESQLKNYGKNKEDIIKFFQDINYDIKQIHDIDYMVIPKLNRIISENKKENYCDEVNKLLQKPRMFFNNNTDGNINTIRGLKDLIEENVDETSIICEIGSFAGVSSELFSIYCKEIYCVDNWSTDNDIWWMKDHIEESEKLFDNMIQKHNNIKKIKKTSEEASKIFPYKYFDLVYIDGAHDYDNVKKDILNWLPKIKDNGIISGHDYYAYNINTETDVKIVLNEIFKSTKIKIYDDSSWLIKKSDINVKISLVCIAKNEDYYLDEWLKYNYKLGFDHIFIYENNWKCNIDLPYLTKIEWNGDYQQLKAYNHFINTYKNEYDYVAFFDCDEFLVLKKHNNIHDFVNDYGYKNISINWQFYGSDSRIKRENNSLLKQFTKRENGVDGHIKTILYLKIDSIMELPHDPNTPTYDTNGKMNIGAFNLEGPDDVAVINHYRDKTLEDYKLKVKRGYADCNRPDSIDNWEERKNIHIEVEDFTARNFMYENQIDHIYQNIDGWFDFEDIYTEMVNRFDNALFVEIGAAWGKSSSYMAVEIANSDKNIKFDVVDKWEDENGSFFDVYLKNIESIKNYINPVKGYSNDVVNQYADNSIDFLFIDASHKYEDVLNDINLWYHKVKHNGIIAGHDYNDGDFPGVVKSVNEYFGKENIKISNWSWIYQKNENNLNNINYLSGGLLGDFIDQLSIIKENYLLTGKKGNLYLVDNNNPPDSFPSDWQNKPCYQLNWRFGIDEVYKDIKDIILKQDYISTFNIYKGEKLLSPIHLSSWRNSTLLYKSSFYEIFKNEYNVEWGSHKWLELPINKIYKDIILISTSIRRFNYIYNFNDLNKYNKKILFVTSDIKEYEIFKNLTNCNFELKVFNNLIDYWIAINSCYLFVSNVSSFTTVAHATNTNTISLLPNNEEDVHFMISNLKWYKNDNENNLDNYDNIKILVVSCCYNEEKILPFYLDYYTNFIKSDKIVIYDGGSTDNSQNIIKEYPNVDLIIDPQDKLDDRYLNDIRNNAWKSYRDKYDWIIVCDIDEFVYHPNLKDKLLEYKNNGITIPLTEGFDMISLKYPNFQKGKYLPNIVKTGIKDPIFLNKKSIFKSSIDINYHIGSHGCDPTGSVKYSDTVEIKHLHFKWLSHKYLTRRSTNVADRLSDWNLSGGCGSHNRPFSLTSLDEFNNRYNQSIQVFENNKKEKILYAFSHNYLINNWEEILNEQLRLIKDNGLYDELTTLFMFAYGNDNEFNKFLNIINSYDDLFRINVNRIVNNFYEYPTLQYLQEFVNKQIDNVYILYFHLKGVWSVNNGNPVAIKSWRKCLEYFTIEKWQNCVNKLNEGYDVVGALYNYNKLEPLFSGNMWWSTSNYIKKLPKLEYVPEKDPYINDPKDDKTWCRVECEKWINKIPNNFYNFYIPKDYGFYFAPLIPNDYREKQSYKISVIIPTYNRFNLLKDAIQSVLNQNYNNFEILVCHDGESIEYNRFKEENKNDKIFYYEIEKRNNYGAAQRNFMLDKVTGDYILHLDDDNIIYPNYFEKMIQQIDDQTGMVICKIHYNDKEWHNYVIPLENRIQDCEIDQLGILFKSDIGKIFKWDDYFGHDHRYIKNCENVIKEKGLEIKYIPDVLASHRFFGEVIPRITIVHHCYLRYKWKEILEEQIFLMKHVGLYNNCTEIYATVYADDKNNIKEFRDIISREDILNKWRIIELEQNNYEFEALKFLKKYSEDKHSYICYFHLKGVISKEIEPNVGIPTWRKYLNYFTINKWKENIEKLKDNDIVCVDWNFNDMHQRYVLGGHFFWTKSEYIRTLDEPINDENRFLSEIWITSNKNCKVYENFNYEKIGFKNLYLQWFNPLLYRKDTIKFVDELVEWSFKKYDTQQNMWEYKEFLKKIIEIGKTGNILEIGSKYGGTTYSFCNIFNEVVSIDIYEENKIIELNKEYNNLNLIIGNSHDTETINKLNNSKFDVIYIDGDHHYDAVKKDYSNYKKFIKDSGIIIFHDIKRTWWTDSVGIQVPILWEEIKNNYKYEEIINNENDCYGIGILYNKSILNNLENTDNFIFLMTSHPNFKMSEDITLKAIRSIKPNKIILSAHCTVSLDIQKEVDYFVYDKNNPLIRHDFFTQSWFETDEYYALLNITKNDNNFNHAMGVYLNYYNSLIYAKSLGFDIAVCTNFDLVFHEKDIKLIEDKIKQMNIENKKAFFMNTPEREGEHFKTIFFITNIDYFLENFKYTTIEKDYTNETRMVGSNTNCLENFFFHTLKNKKNDLLLQEINENDLFSNSEINLFSLIEYYTILPVENEPDAFVIWFSSANSLDSRNFEISINRNNMRIILYSSPIDKNFVYYKKFKFNNGDNFEIVFNVINENEILKNKVIIVNDEIFNDIKSYGKFIDKRKINEIDFNFSYTKKEQYMNLSNNTYEEEILKNMIVYEPFNSKIRIGVDSDGGYVIIDGYEYDQFISAGVGGGGNTFEDISFENGLLQKYQNLKGFIFDGTINNSPYNLSNNIIFVKKNIGSISNESLTNLKEYAENFNNIFIKMDIDGSEWDWILVFDEYFSKVKQIVFEAHGIFDNKGYPDTNNEKILKCLQILNKTHHLVHAHSNNCSNIFYQIGDYEYPVVMELTFIRKDCNISGLNTQDIPTEFDFPNWPGTIDHNINFWPFNSKSRIKNYEKFIDKGEINKISFNSKEYTILSPDGNYTKRKFRDDNIIFDEYNLIYSEMWENSDCDSNGCIYQRHECKIEKNDVVLDIGANIGLFTNRAAHDGASKIICIEPSKLSFKCLLDNVPDNTEIYKFALSDKKGYDILKTPTIGHLGCATFFGDEDHFTSEKVYTTTIDDLYNDGILDKVDFIKIDTEGSEIKILNGMSNETLEKMKVKKISIEFHDLYDQSTMENTIRRFELLGFKFFILYCNTNKIINLWK